MLETQRKARLELEERRDGSDWDCGTGRDGTGRVREFEGPLGLVSELGKKSVRREREQEGWIKKSPRWERK